MKLGNFYLGAIFIFLSSFLGAFWAHKVSPEVDRDMFFVGFCLLVAGILLMFFSKKRKEWGAKKTWGWILGWATISFLVLGFMALAVLEIFF